MSEPPESDFESMPDWVQAALERALKRQPAPSPLAHRAGDAWPLLVEAAVVRSFLPRDLAPNAVDTENRSNAEGIVLGFAETTYGPDGVQWSLTQQSRAEVVDAAWATGDLQKAIDDTTTRFKDDISFALRTCLTQGSDLVQASDLKSLEATRIAVASLAGVSTLKLPSLKLLDREIELRRLLAQFERMIGRRSDTTGSAKKDRFFGRADELEKLRGYVGVISAATLFGSAKRVIDSVFRKIKGRGALAVWGVGGAGKTTLISKFMLEHAEAASSRYPFAYLDFDRATIGARQRLGLLAEMCRQAGTQFDELAEPMAKLQTEVRELARRLESTKEFEYISYVAPYCLKFRKLVDQLLESLESRFEWSRPFLLVFDTFELVQYTEGEIEGQDDIKGLEDFVQGFSEPNEGPWPRLRLIISGRKKITHFLGEVEDLPVGALDPQGSAELLVALSADADNPITEAQAKRVVTAVAKKVKEPNRGVQPLRLRLIGEVFRDPERDGQAIVQSLVDELSKPLKSHGLAAKILIDGILVRRVLEHVADGRVRALADPGLVVRRITPEVIEKVMTRG
ncbi:MAG TPA: hypothetical protein VFH31_05530, partial [Pyrinomonadaceae bacterium]|nr:hypothetical protein [Pyrinomonadaceae bacterium]